MNSIIKEVVLFCVFLLFFSFRADAQVYKYRTNAYCSKLSTEMKFSSWEKTNVLITVDLEKDRIKIYSNITQIYDIIENEGTKTDSDGDNTLSLFCVDANGLECRIRLVSRKSGTLELYCDYSDISWVYDIYSLD